MAEECWNDPLWQGHALEAARVAFNCNDPSAIAGEFKRLSPDVPARGLSAERARLAGLLLAAIQLAAEARLRRRLRGWTIVGLESVGASGTILSLLSAYLRALGMREFPAANETLGLAAVWFVVAFLGRGWRLEDDASLDRWKEVDSLVLAGGSWTREFRAALSSDARDAFDSARLEREQAERSGIRIDHVAATVKQTAGIPDSVVSEAAPTPTEREEQDRRPPPADASITPRKDANS